MRWTLYSEEWNLLKICHKHSMLFLILVGRSIVPLAMTVCMHFRDVYTRNTRFTHFAHKHTTHEHRQAQFDSIFNNKLIIIICHTSFYWLHWNSHFQKSIHFKSIPRTWSETWKIKCVIKCVKQRCWWKIKHHLEIPEDNAHFHVIAALFQNTNLTHFFQHLRVFSIYSRVILQSLFEWKFKVWTTLFMRLFHWLSAKWFYQTWFDPESETELMFSLSTTGFPLFASKIISLFNHNSSHILFSN